MDDSERSTKLRLLVVEDEPDLLLGLVKALREEGYVVDTAEDGVEGLHKAAQADYDAIMLDLMLPGIDGFDLLARLRKIKRTPVLALTALDQTTDRVRGLDCGADDYVVKPCDLHELLARLRVLIRRHSSYARPIIQIGDVAIDMMTRAVLRSGTTIPLTSREYLLLEFLANHRGEVVPRSVLCQHLFEEADGAFSDQLDAHVEVLCNKLGQGFISSHSGHGYCLES